MTEPTLTARPLETLEHKGTAFEVLSAFTWLGFTCFGGPIAHIGYFRTEFVGKRRWLTDAAFADLVGLCQFLPGPASSKLGFSLGLMRAGYWGGLAAWVGFTLPSAIALVAFAYGAGAQFRIWSISVRAEYEAFDLGDIDDLNMISVGLTYTFL